MCRGAPEREEHYTWVSTTPIRPSCRPAPRSPSTPGDGGLPAKQPSTEPELVGRCPRPRQVLLAGQGAMAGESRVLSGPCRVLVPAAPGGVLAPLQAYLQVKRRTGKSRRRPEHRGQAPVSSLQCPRRQPARSHQRPWSLQHPWSRLAVALVRGSGWLSRQWQPSSEPRWEVESQRQSGLVGALRPRCWRSGRARRCSPVTPRCRR